MRSEAVRMPGETARNFIYEKTAATGSVAGMGRGLTAVEAVPGARPGLFEAKSAR